MSGPKTEPRVDVVILKGRRGAMAEFGVWSFMLTSPDGLVSAHYDRLGRPIRKPPP